jgi:hypothetical protein
MESYRNISLCVDSLVCKIGTQRLSELLTTINHTFGIGESKDLEFIVVVNSFCNVFDMSTTNLMAGTSRIDTEARMMCFHLLHRKYNKSIREIGDYFLGVKVGSVHRFIKQMDGYLTVEKHHEDLVYKYKEGKQSTKRIIKSIKEVK